jgi:hypothetical protein
VATPIPIAALATNVVVRKSLGLAGPPQDLVGLRKSQRRVRFPQPVAQLPSLHIFDLRDVRAWAAKKNRAFHVETDIDTGPTIDPDRLATTTMVGHLLGYLCVGWQTPGFKTRHPHFPLPVTSLSNRKLWDIEDVEAWADRHDQDTYFLPERPVLQRRPPAES